MKALIRELLPHAPQMGLYLAPDIPSDKLQGALEDYARDLRGEDVLALYDATLMGSARDGAVFTADQLVFQNNDLEEVQTVRYRDIVRVNKKRKLLGGRKVLLDVNRGRSTFQLTLDFSGKSDAAEYVERFLSEAMLRSEDQKAVAPVADPETSTDRKAVRRALRALCDEGLLAERDFDRMMAALDEK